MPPPALQGLLQTDCDANQHDRSAGVLVSMPAVIEHSHDGSPLPRGRSSRRHTIVLPPEVLTETMGYLDPRDLLSCALVCRAFTPAAMSVLWRTIPLSDLCDFAEISSAGPSSRSNSPRRSSSRRRSSAGLLPAGSSGSNHLHFQTTTASSSNLTVPTNDDTDQLLNRARLFQIGPGCRTLVVTRYALPLSIAVLKVIPEACPRLDKIKFFHDPTIFDPEDEELEMDDEDMNGDVITRIKNYQRSDHHIRDVHVATIMSHIGSHIRAIWLDGVLGLSGESLNTIRMNCPNLVHLRIRFCLDESARQALCDLVDALPYLRSLSLVGLGTNLFGPALLRKVANLKSLRSLRLDTDGTDPPFTEVDTHALVTEDAVAAGGPQEIFKTLEFLSLSRSQGGFKPAVVIPILSLSSQLVEIILSCHLDPVVAALEPSGGTLRRLSVMVSMRRCKMTNNHAHTGGDMEISHKALVGPCLTSNAEVTRVAQESGLLPPHHLFGASDAGLIALGKACPNLTSFHLYCGPSEDSIAASDMGAPATLSSGEISPTSASDSRLFAVPISDIGITALAASCPNLTSLSVKSGHPFSMPAVTDKALTNLMRLPATSKTLVDLRLSPGSLKLQLDRDGEDRHIRFQRLSVALLGCPTEGFATRGNMESFVREFCPEMASFRFVDGECSRDYTRAREMGVGWWDGWEEDFESDEEEDEVDEDDADVDVDMEDVRDDAMEVHDSLGQAAVVGH